MVVSPFRKQRPGGDTGAPKLSYDLSVAPGGFIGALVASGHVAKPADYGID